MNWEINLPNLDTCSAGEREFFSSLLMEISAYLLLKSKIEAHYAAGDLEMAGFGEAAAEDLYARLPDNVKWRGEWVE